MIFPRPLFFHAIRKSSAAEYVAPLLSTIAGFEWYPFGRGVTCPAGRSVNSSSVPRALSVGLYFRIRSRDVINGCSAKSFKISKPILLLPPPFSRRSRISAEASGIFGNASPHCLTEASLSKPFRATYRDDGYRTARRGYQSDRLARAGESVSAGFSYAENRQCGDGDVATDSSVDPRSGI